MAVAIEEVLETVEELEAQVVAVVDFVVDVEAVVVVEGVVAAAMVEVQVTARAHMAEAHTEEALVVMDLADRKAITPKELIYENHVGIWNVFPHLRKISTIRLLP